MSKIVIEDRVYQIHPIYDLYGADEGGHIINIVKKVPSKGCKHHDGYMRCLVRKHGQNGFKSLSVHRFVWECFNGIITGDKVIDHINNIRDDNRLCNLQLMTQQQNCKKSAKARDYTFNAYNHLNRKYVKAVNQDTYEVTFYNSMHAIQQHLGINAGFVNIVCEGLNRCKTGFSKTDKCRYKFEYMDANELPVNYKRSANKRQKE